MAARIIHIPAGFEPDGVGAPLLTITIQLVTADLHRPVIALDGSLQVGNSLIQVAGEDVTFPLSVNADLTPIGSYSTVDAGGAPLTRWRVRMTAEGIIYQAAHVIVPAGETEITLSELLAVA